MTQYKPPLRVYNSGCWNGDTLQIISLTTKFCYRCQAFYVFLSGIIDIFHGFLSTVDPTDRFIRVLAGIVGCVMGFVILNAGNFEVMTFIRFFGVYLLVVGVTSMIYGVHNRAQKIEDKVARSESAKKKTSKKSVAKKSTAKKHTRKK